MHITDAQLATYKEQGFLIIKNFLSDDEREAALDGFFTLFAPPYDQYIAEGKKNNTPGQSLFPWDHSGLNHVVTHPNLVSAAERILDTQEIRLCEGHLGIKYAGEKHWTSFHIDYGNNTLGPHVECDDFMNLACFYCFDDVDEGMAPIRMVPNNEPEENAVPMIVPGGSVCLYSIFTRHAASEFTASTGHRPAMWVGFTRKDRAWDGGRSFTYKSGASVAGMGRFMADATPRQLELLGFPPLGDALWTKEFLEGMSKRYSGFSPEPYFSKMEENHD